MSVHAGASDKSDEAKEVKHEAQDFRFGALEDGLQVLKLEDNALITLWGECLTPILCQR